MKKPGHMRSKDARALGPLINRTIDPVLKKRAGLIADLTAMWPQIVGDDLARVSRIVRIRWPKMRPFDEMEAAEPATLVIAATGMHALRLQHMTGEIIEKANAYFGYHAIGRIKLEQRVVSPLAARPAAQRPAVPTGKLDEATARSIREKTRGIHDDGLRDAMEALGRRVAARKLE